MMRRLPTVGPDSEPLWVRLYVHPLGDHWAAMIVADDVDPPLPGELKGTGFFGTTRLRRRSWRSDTSGCPSR